MANHLPPTTTTTTSNSNSPFSDRLSFLFKCLKGTIVQIELMDSRKLEGIWDRIFSDEKTSKPSFSLTLVRCWQTPTSKATIEHAFITAPLDEIKRMGTTSHPNGSLNFTEATGDSFGTDSEISEENSLNTSANVGNRTLSPWITDTKELLNTSSSLDSGLSPATTTTTTTQKWNQFEANKKLFGVETTFHENDYTTPLQNVSSKSLRNAERLAKEIEGSFSSSQTTNIHRREERGMSWRSGSRTGGDDSQIDEEDLYGAVIRENQQQPAAAIMAISAESIELSKLSSTSSLLNPGALDFVPGSRTFNNDYAVDEVGFTSQYEPSSPISSFTTATTATTTTTTLNPSASVFNPFAKEFVP